MRTRVSILGVVFATAALASTARAERICKWMDSEGVLHITNVCGGHHHGSKVKADPSFSQYVQGADAPLAFVPNDRTAKYDPFIKEACEKYRMPPALVRAIMNAESNFDPRAMSEKGALGLMQLMPDTGEELGASDILNPRQNILCGVHYLRELTNLFDGDFIRVVAAYNAGPKAVVAAGGVPEIPETQDYVHKVIRLYYQYKSQPQPQPDSETASAH